MHPLIATTVYRSIPPALRVGLHNAAAEAVRAAGLGPTAAARHLLEVPCEGRPSAVACLREAAREYLRSGAPEAARRVLSRALQEPPPPQDRAALLHELAGATFLIDPAATVSHLREALAEPDVEPGLRASIVYRLTQALAHTDQMAQAALVAAEEARRSPNPRIRLRMRADHFVWSAFRTDEPDSPARSRRLARLAARLPGRGLEERYILGLRAWDALVRGEPRRTALGHAEDALRGGLSWTGDNRGFEVPVSVALVFMYADQPGRAEELFARGIAECEAKGWRGSHLALGHALFGYIRYRRGCLAEAEVLAREGLRIAERVEGAVPAQWFAVGILVQTLLARGRTAAARRIADTYRYGETVPNAVIYPDPRTVHAELLLAEGRHRAAERQLTEVGERLDERGWRNPAWCPWQLHLASALAPTDPGRAVRLARDAVARARDFGAASVIGQALHAEAEATGGAAALERYAEAVEELERSPASYELARALVGHGAALARGGRVPEAADRLYQGLERAVHCGAEGLAARARAELSAAGLRPLPLRYARTEALTTRERRAAELTAQGEPVAVVAKELGLTEQGVRQLLSSVYRKLGTDRAGLPAPCPACHAGTGDPSGRGAGAGRVRRECVPGVAGQALLRGHPLAVGAGRRAAGGAGHCPEDRGGGVGGGPRGEAGRSVGGGPRRGVRSGVGGGRGHGAGVRVTVAVAALGAAGDPVAQGDLGSADGVEVLQVAAGADPGDAGQGGALAGGQGVLGGPQRPFDQLGRLHAHALGQRRDRRRRRRARQDAVHVGLAADDRLPQAPALDGVPLQAGLEVLELERLEEVVDDTVPHGAAHGVRLAGRADHHDVAVVPGGAQPGNDVEPEQVRQVQVEQDQVGPERVDGRDGLLAGAGDADDVEGLDALDEGAVHPGHHEVVVDHQNADRPGRAGPTTAPAGTGHAGCSGPTGCTGRAGRAPRTARPLRAAHRLAPSATASARWLTVMRAVNIAPSGVFVTDISPP